MTRGADSNTPFIALDLNKLNVESHKGRWHSDLTRDERINTVVSHEVSHALDRAGRLRKNARFFSEDTDFRVYGPLWNEVATASESDGTVKAWFQHIMDAPQSETIHRELFAQLGALRAVKPEIFNEHFPKARDAFERVINEALELTRPVGTTGLVAERNTAAPDTHQAGSGVRPRTEQRNPVANERGTQASVLAGKGEVAGQRTGVRSSLVQREQVSRGGDGRTPVLTEKPVHPALVNKTRRFVIDGKPLNFANAEAVIGFVNQANRVREYLRQRVAEMDALDEAGQLTKEREQQGLDEAQLLDALDEMFDQSGHAAFDWESLLDGVEGVTKKDVLRLHAAVAKANRGRGKESTASGRIIHRGKGTPRAAPRRLQLPVLGEHAKYDPRPGSIPGTQGTKILTRRDLVKYLENRGVAADNDIPTQADQAVKSNDIADYQALANALNAEMGIEVPVTVRPIDPKRASRASNDRNNPGAKVKRAGLHRTTSMWWINPTKWIE